MTHTKPGPIEVWLTQANMVVSYRVVYEDETTSEYDVESLSMRGAQREVTGDLINQGYKPDGRWVTESVEMDQPIETWRRFRPPSNAAEELAAQYSLARKSHPDADIEKISEVVVRRMEESPALFAQLASEDGSAAEGVRQFIYEMEGPSD